MKGKYITTSLILAVKAVTLNSKNIEIISSKDELKAFKNVWNKAWTNNPDELKTLQHFSIIESTAA